MQIRLSKLCMHLLAATLLVSPVARAQTIPEADLASDLAEWQAWLFATHPDPQHTMDLAEVEQAFEAAANSIRPAQSLRSAWLEAATLNQHFNDAHVGLRLPDQAYAAALKRGAVPFPLPVEIIDGSIRLAGDPSTEILSINDTPAERIVAVMAPRMRGDSRRLQEHVLSLRFPVALWVMLGDQTAYTVDLRDKDGEVQRDALPPPASDPEPSVHNFEFALIDETAILTVRTFDRTLETDFGDFVAQSFEAIADAGATRLLIDLRENGGGARELSDQLMAYLTSERYTPISAVTARITPENQPMLPGSKLGQVVHTPFAQWVTPPVDLENRFMGEVAILIGPATYSQAIAFAVTAQDFNIATLLGAPTEGRANQTAQVQHHTLPKTGFEIQAPLYVFTRPSGATDATPLTPDIPIAGTGAIQLKAAIASDWNARAGG